MFPQNPEISAWPRGDAQASGDAHVHSPATSVARFQKAEGPIVGQSLRIVGPCYRNPLPYILLSHLYENSYVFGYTHGFYAIGGPVEIPQFRWAFGGQNVGLSNRNNT